MGPDQLLVFYSPHVAPACCAPGGFAALSPESPGHGGAQQTPVEFRPGSAPAGPEHLPQAAGLGPRGAAGTGTHPSNRQGRDGGQAGYQPGHRPSLPPHAGPCSLSPGPSLPQFTSRAADRHSSASHLLWLSLWPPGALLCGQGLDGPCQLSSRTRTRAMLGRGPGACARSGPSTSNLRRPKQAEGWSSQPSPRPHTRPRSGEGPAGPSPPSLPAGLLPFPGPGLTPLPGQVTLPVSLQAPWEEPHPGPHVLSCPL